jgi:hypothetical protein
MGCPSHFSQNAREMGHPWILHDDITTQGPSTSLALLCSGRDDRVGKVDKVPTQGQIGLESSQLPVLFQFMVFLSRGLDAGICSKLRIQWEK